MKSAWTRPSRREVAAGCLVALALAALVCGWQAFWYLTDDAYIAFRYVSNSMLGAGYVWNAPPFRPVEGYTSFLWVVLLDLVWRGTGIEPPEAANALLLGFSALTLLATAGMVWRLPLRRELEPARPLFLGLVLAGVVSNRTFLAASSSGLETALFNFLLTSWVFIALFVGRERSWRRPALHGAAALAALVRPDGLLFYAATLAIWICEAMAERSDAEEAGPGIADALQAWRSLPLLVPLALVPAHLLWRHQIYGEWLPNTYYAKHVRPWPEAGVRYLLSFVLEYALWIWLALALLWIGRELRRRKSFRGLVQWFLARKDAPDCLRATRALVVTAVLAHAGYYVLVIGGDHFEYRVLSQLVPLIFVSAVWLLDALDLRRAPAIALLLSFVLASWPIPWVHYHRSQQLTTRAETLFMKVAVADAFPAPLRGYARLFDRTQTWLIDHMVCTRHREHQVFHRFWASYLMPRELGATAPADGLPVLVAGSVGLPGWVLPRANVIDVLGLNDRVIARVLAPPNARRHMGHDRVPPQGYVQCFRPNVYLRYRRARTAPRHPPLTAEEVRACESRDWLTG